jgi:hypothetical protein
VTITAAESVNFQAQPASWSLEVSSGVLDQAVFTDDYAGARGVFDIVDSVYPAFVASKLLTIPNQAPQNNVFYTSTVTTNGSRLTTFQLDTLDLTGNLSVEGATVDDNEWYIIPVENLATGNTVSVISFANANSRLGINVEGYHPLIRLAIQKQNGNVEAIAYR